MRVPGKPYIVGCLLLIVLLIIISLIIVFVQGGVPKSIQPVVGEKTPSVIPTESSTKGNNIQVYPPVAIEPVVGGKVYYVSPSGEDTNDGSQAQPFATIEKAAKVVKPGAIVHVLPGVYTQPVIVNTSGRVNERITFISDTRWGAKIQTSGSSDPWTTRASYIDIVGFDVTSTGSRDGIANLGSYIRTMSNHVHDIPGGCDSTGGAGINDGSYKAHDDDDIGNVVNNIGDTYPKLCEYVHGIYHSTARGHVVDNITYDNAGCGINLWHAADATIVSNNLSFGNEEHGISIGTDTSNTGGKIGDYFVVSNNISIDNALLGIRERKGVGPHNQYLNNIMYGNGNSAFGDEEYNWPSAVGSKDVHTITDSVQFVQYKVNGSGDYHLQASSPAVGAGTTVGEPSTDFDGRERPQGSGVDIGPYQSVSGG